MQRVGGTNAACAIGAVASAAIKGDRITVPGTARADDDDEESVGVHPPVACACVGGGVVRSSLLTVEERATSLAPS